MKITVGIVLLGMGGLLSCQAGKDPAPVIKANLTETWWCDAQQILPDQYFGEAGEYRQRQRGVIQSGQWSISDDNKSILISNFGAKGEGTWAYGLKNYQNDKLVITFYGADNAFGRCQ